MLRHDGWTRLRLRLAIDRPEVPVVDVLQRYGHDAGPAIDVDLAEELQSETGREVFPLRLTAPVLVHRNRTKGIVEVARPPCAGMQGPRDELPERFELLELRPVRIVIMRCGVVHVGGEPDDVAEAGALHGREKIGDLVLAP